MNDLISTAAVCIQQLEEQLRELSYKSEKSENTIQLLRDLVEDFLPQIGLTIHFRQMFYQVVGDPYPDWFEVPKPNFYEKTWIENHSFDTIVRKKE